MFLIVGNIAIHLSTTFSVFRFERINLFYFIGMVAGALLMPFFLRIDKRIPFAIILTCAFISASSHIAAVIFGAPNLPFWPPPFCMGLVLPVIIYLFFTNTPVRSQGLAFGLAICAWYLGWLTMIPLVQMAVSGYELTIYVHKLQGAVQFATCVITAAAWIKKDEHPPEPQRQYRPAKYMPAVLTTLFSFYLIFGMLFGVGYMRSVLHRNSITDIYYLLLLSAPFLGILIDRKSKGMKIMFVVLIFIVFSAPLVYMQDSLNAVFVVFAVARQAIFMLARQSRISANEPDDRTALRLACGGAEAPPPSEACSFDSPRGVMRH